MALTIGDNVSWNTPQGPTHGVVREKRTKDFQLHGQDFTATDDDPMWIVESDKTGARAAHRGSALTKHGG